MKVKEPTAEYYTRPQIMKLKEQLIASIHQEQNVEVLKQCADLLHTSETVYDDAYFSKQDEEFEYLRGQAMPCVFEEMELDAVIRESEQSGLADSKEVEAFINRWINLK